MWGEEKYNRGEIKHLPVKYKNRHLLRDIRDEKAIYGKYNMKEEYREYVHKNSRNWNIIQKYKENVCFLFQNLLCLITYSFNGLQICIKV